MQGSERAEPLEGLEHSPVYPDGRSVLEAAVDDPVAAPDEPVAGQPLA